MMRITRYPSLIFYGLAILYFIADLSFFSWFEKPCIYSLLCFFLLRIMHHAGPAQIIVMLILLSLNALIFYARFGLTLLYLIPLTFLAFHMSHTLYVRRWYPYCLLISSLLAQTILIEYFILHLPISAFYTISVIFFNLLLMFMVSLKS